MQSLQAIFRSSAFAWGALIAILAIAFVLRFAALDYPLATNAGEGFRDLFVARHALWYGEWPLSGYQNGLSSVDNSPLYYYLVIALSLAGPSFLPVGIAYVVFSCLIIAGVFMLVRAVFGTFAGLLAASLLTIAPAYIVHAGTFLWPPYLVAPFVLGGFLALWHAYCAYRPRLLATSAIFMAAAVAIHQSALPICAAYLALAAYVGFRRYPLRDTVIAGATGVAVFALLFLPSILSALGEGIAWGSRGHTYFPVARAEALARAFQQLPYAYGALWLFRSAWGLAFCAALVLLALWFFWSSRVSRVRKVVLLILVGTVSLQVAAAIVIDPEGVPRHFEPALWMLAAALAALIAAPWGRSFPMSALALALLLALAHGALTDERMGRVYAHLPAFDRPNESYAIAASDAMADTVRQLVADGRIPDYTYFDIYVLGGTHFVVSPYVFWYLLEDRLDTPLMQGPDRVLRSFVQRRSRDYLFLVCMRHDTPYPPSVCQQDFAADQPHHELTRTVFESDELSVYLAQRRGETPASP